jgi:four helix bundle protein
MSNDKNDEFLFEKLDVYKRAVKLAHDIYDITSKFPKSETFGLINQIRRSCVSISLNIAEGSARGKKEFSHFLDISRGSIFESLSILQISLQEEYINQEVYSKLKSELGELSKMLMGLKRSLVHDNE